LISIQNVKLIDPASSPDSKQFFLNTWPMYVHELAGLGSRFYSLDARGCWQPHISPDWVATVTADVNLRWPVAADDPRQPLQRTHVIARGHTAMGFVCVGLAPFKYMPDDVDYELSELFLTHGHRGHGVSRRALELLLASYPPGRWSLRVLPGNARALRFWSKVLPALGVRELERGLDRDDVTWRFVTTR
jgi:predicted acetyltransferase